MRRVFAALAALTVLFALAGCGGGSGNGGNGSAPSVTAFFVTEANGVEEIFSNPTQVGGNQNIPPDQFMVDVSQAFGSGQPITYTCETGASQGKTGYTTEKNGPLPGATPPIVGTYLETVVRSSNGSVLLTLDLLVQDKISYLVATPSAEGPLFTHVSLADSNSAEQIYLALKDVSGANDSDTKNLIAVMSGKAIPKAAGFF